MMIPAAWKSPLLALAGGAVLVGAFLMLPPAPSADKTPRRSDSAQTVQAGESTRSLIDRLPSRTRPSANDGFPIPASVISTVGKNPDRIVADMLPLAQSGSVEAMRYLGETLQQCAKAAQGTDRENEAHQIEQQLLLQDLMKKSGVKIDAAKQADELASALEAQKNFRDECAKLDPHLDSWVQWLERSASAGDAAAKRDYVNLAFADFLDQGIQLTDLDEAMRRRVLVKQFSEDLLAGGDCSVLSSLQWSVADPALTYAYQLAYVGKAKKDAMNQGADPASFVQLDNYLSEQAASLSPQQRVAAQDGASYVLQNFCDD